MIGISWDDGDKDLMEMDGQTATDRGTRPTTYILIDSKIDYFFFAEEIHSVSHPIWEQRC